MSMTLIICQDLLRYLVLLRTKMNKQNSVFILLRHLSHSGDLLLRVGVRRALASCSQDLIGQSKPNLEW